MHAALARQIAAARRDQALLFVLQPCQVMAQTLEHETLKIEHTVAVLASGGAQQPQGIWMPIEKIGVLAQIGNDIAGADLAGLRRLRAAGAGRLWLVLRTVSHV